MDFCQHNEVKLLIFLGWVLFLFGSLYSVLKLIAIPHQGCVYTMLDIYLEVMIFNHYPDVFKETPQMVDIVPERSNVGNFQNFY